MAEYLESLITFQERINELPENQEEYLSFLNQMGHYINSTFKNSFGNTNEQTNNLIKKASTNYLSIVIRFYSEETNKNQIDKLETYLKILSKFFEIITDKKELLQEVGQSIFDVLQDDVLLNNVKFHVLSYFNTLINDYGHNDLFEIYQFHLCKLMDDLSICGDYDQQESSIELILRLSPCMKNIKVAKSFFPESTDFATRLSNINKERFEADCRDFLNELNNVYKHVISLQAHAVYLEQSRLIPQQDFNNVLWVDFNLGKSKSIRVPCSSKCLSNQSDEDYDGFDGIKVYEEQIESLDVTYEGISMNKRCMIQFKLSAPVNTYLVSSKKFVEQARLLKIIFNKESSVSEIKQYLSQVFPNKYSLNEQVILRTEYSPTKTILNQPLSSIYSFGRDLGNSIKTKKTTEELSSNHSLNVATPSNNDNFHTCPTNSYDLKYQLFKLSADIESINSRNANEKSNSKSKIFYTTSISSKKYSSRISSCTLDLISENEEATEFTKQKYHKKFRKNVSKTSNSMENLPSTRESTQSNTFVSTDIDVNSVLAKIRAKEDNFKTSVQEVDSCKETSEHTSVQNESFNLSLQPSTLASSLVNNIGTYVKNDKNKNTVNSKVKNSKKSQDNIKSDLKTEIQKKNEFKESSEESSEISQSNTSKPEKCNNKRLANKNNPKKYELMQKNENSNDCITAESNINEDSLINNSDSKSIQYKFSDLKKVTESKSISEDKEPNDSTNKLKETDINSMKSPIITRKKIIDDIQMKKCIVNLKPFKLENIESKIIYQHSESDSNEINKSSDSDNGHVIKPKILKRIKHKKMNTRKALEKDTNESTCRPISSNPSSVSQKPIKDIKKSENKPKVLLGKHMSNLSYISSEVFSQKRQNKKSVSGNEELLDNKNESESALNNKVTSTDYKPDATTKIPEQKSKLTLCKNKSNLSYISSEFPSQNKKFNSNAIRNESIKENVDVSNIDVNKNYHVETVAQTKKLKKKLKTKKVQKENVSNSLPKKDSKIKPLKSSVENTSKNDLIDLESNLKKPTEEVRNKSDSNLISEIQQISNSVNKENISKSLNKIIVDSAHLCDNDLSSDDEIIKPQRLSKNLYKNKRRFKNLKPSSDSEESAPETKTYLRKKVKSKFYNKGMNSDNGEAPNFRDKRNKNDVSSVLEADKIAKNSLNLNNSIQPTPTLEEETENFNSQKTNKKVRTLLPTRFFTNKGISMQMSNIELQNNEENLLNIESNHDNIEPNQPNIDIIGIKTAKNLDTCKKNRQNLSHTDSINNNVNLNQSNNIRLSQLSSDSEEPVIKIRRLTPNRAYNKVMSENNLNNKNETGDYSIKGDTKPKQLTKDKLSINHNINTKPEKNDDSKEINLVHESDKESGNIDENDVNMMDTNLSDSNKRDPEEYSNKSSGFNKITIIENILVNTKSSDIFKNDNNITKDDTDTNSNHTDLFRNKEHTANKPIKKRRLFNKNDSSLLENRFHKTKKQPTPKKEKASSFLGDVSIKKDKMETTLLSINEMSRNVGNLTNDEYVSWMDKTMSGKCQKYLKNQNAQETVIEFPKCYNLNNSDAAQALTTYFKETHEASKKMRDAYKIQRLASKKFKEYLRSSQKN